MAHMIGLMRLGRDVEVRYTQSGDAVANLSLAFDYGKKGDDGKRPTTWIEAALWGKRADALAPHLLKGTLVSVVLGDPHIETYEGKNGTGYKIKANVIELEFAGGGKDRGEQPTQKESRPAHKSGDTEDDVPF